MLNLLQISLSQLTDRDDNNLETETILMENQVRF